MLTLEEAQGRLLDGVTPLGSDKLPVGDCLGRYLATDCLAARTQPVADLSAMDGYAMRAGDNTGPWRVIGESAAGHPFAGMVSAGEAVRISTGAMMPTFADGDTGAVLLQENAVREGSRLSLSGESAPTPRHIRRKGFDFSTGDMLLPAGAYIDAAQLALAIAGGHGQLAVTRLPKVAIIDSGDELAADPANIAPHQLPASNGAMLGAMAAPCACAITRLGPVPDQLEALLTALESAYEADVIVTSGGASVGDHDLVRPALEQWGAKIDFWKVAMKPGKPLMVARRGKQIVLGLPGNPVSSYVTAYLFLLPLLRRLAGAVQPLPAPIEVSLVNDLPATGGRMEFLRGVLAGGEVMPLAQQDSSGLRALATANVLIRREIRSPAASAGEKVQAYLLGNGGASFTTT